MSDAPLVSIIIRTKNEERWIGHCLRNVANQDYPNFELIVVDNQSTDKTLRKVSDYDVTLVEIDEFFPGKAINDGIRAAKGEYLVCLSGHCIPVNSMWLGNLVHDLEDTDVAGVYGRQEPMSFSTPFDKRDLITVFGLDKKVQYKDPFFHNANSAFRREVWERFPLDEEVTNIEDRLWAKEVLSDGMKIVYEPEASVYHYHGIHHDMDYERANMVVRVLESSQEPTQSPSHDRIDDYNVIAIIPAKGEINWLGDEPQLKYTIDSALSSRHIKDVVVTTDQSDVAELAEKLGARVPLLRPPELSEDFVDIRQVYQFTLDEIEKSGTYPDLIVTMEETYPFRPKDLIDKMIQELIEEGMDSVIAGQCDYRRIWLRQNGTMQPIGDDYMPRGLKRSAAFIDLHGMACVTHPEHMRDGSLVGDKMGIYEIENKFMGIPIRDDRSRAAAQLLMANWFNKEEA